MLEERSWGGRGGAQRGRSGLELVPRRSRVERLRQRRKAGSTPLVAIPDLLSMQGRVVKVPGFGSMIGPTIPKERRLSIVSKREVEMAALRMQRAIL